MAEQDITQTPNPSDRLFGGAPNTTSSGDGTIQPNPTSAPAPAPAPAAPVAAQPAVSQPAPQPRVVQAPPPADAHEMRKNIFGSILQTLGGGQMYVNRTDPETGETTRVPVYQTKGQLARNLVAGALTGMIAGMDARSGGTEKDPRGYHDPMKAAAMGFNAAGEMLDKRQGALQRQADEPMLRKQQVMKANLDLVHAQMMNAHLQNENVDYQVKHITETAKMYQDGILADARVLDSNLTGTDAQDKSKKAIQQEHLTHDQALAALNGHWSDQLAIPDGYKMTRNAQGVMEPEPTYAILNPNVQIKMSADQAAKFAKYVPSYKNAYDSTGGNLVIGLHNYASDMHDYATYEKVGTYLDRVKDGLGIDNTKSPDLASLISGKDGYQVKQAAKDVENALAQGGDPVAVLQRLAGSSGGMLILQKMGISDDQVTGLINKKIAAAREAQAVGDKAPADAAAIAQIPSLAKRMGLSDAETAAASAELPAKGATRADVAKVLENIRHQHDTNMQLAASKEKDQGDPAMIDRIARHLVDDPTSLTTMRDLGTRGTQRMAIQDRALQIAEAEGKHFDVGLLNQRVKFLEQYEDPKGKAAINRQAINNIMQHAADVYDLNQLNKRSSVKIVNTPVNELKDQFGDQIFTQYQTATGVLKDELGLYFAGGYAPTTDQKKMWDKIQADTATPAQTEAFAKEVVRLATRRADTFNQGFKTNMGYDDPNMITPQAKRAAERLGIDVSHFGSGGQLGGPVVKTTPAVTPATTFDPTKFPKAQ